MDYFSGASENSSSYCGLPIGRIIEQPILLGEWGNHDIIE